MSKEPDRLFAQPLAQVPDFAFNEDVVRVFPDMIKRSVPGYPTIVENLGVLAAQFAQPNSVLYDLGSSLGAVTQALRRHVRTDGCRVIAVDNSAAMVERCREYLNGQDSMFQELLPVEVIEGDILALEFQPASVVALNFTLQFIAPDQRTALLSRIRQSLLPGGALILSEKLRFNDAEEHALLTDLHVAFKTRQRLQRTGNRPEAQRHRKRHEARQPRRTPRTPAGRRVLESRAVVPVS